MLFPGSKVEHGQARQEGFGFRSTAHGFVWARVRVVLDIWLDGWNGMIRRAESYS